MENNKNIKRRKSSDERDSFLITDDPPNHNNKTAIETPIDSIIGDDIKRNFDDLNRRLKYFHDSLLKRSFSFSPIAKALIILIEVNVSVIILNIPPICFVFLLALRLILLPIVCIIS